MMEPCSEVFEVRHVGYVQLQFTPPPAGGDGGGAPPEGGPLAAGDDEEGGEARAGWRLASSEAGETGAGAWALRPGKRLAWPRDRAARVCQGPLPPSLMPACAQRAPEPLPSPTIKRAPCPPSPILPGVFWLWDGP
jgi:hypothetical protein